MKCHDQLGDNSDGCKLTFRGGKLILIMGEIGWSPVLLIDLINMEIILLAKSESTIK